jgi:hypothetical protein
MRMAGWEEGCRWEREAKRVGRGEGRRSING